MLPWQAAQAHTRTLLQGDQKGVLFSNITGEGNITLGFNAMIRIYDEAGNVIETHEHTSDLKEPRRIALESFLIARSPDVRPVCHRRCLHTFTKPSDALPFGIPFVIRRRLYLNLIGLWQIGLNFGKTLTRPSQKNCLVFRFDNCAITKTTSWKCRVTIIRRSLRTKIRWHRSG